MAPALLIPVEMDSGPHADSLAKLDGLNVLVVDDDPDALDLLATVLETCSARVSCATSAGDALASMLQHKPDVLISDIGMPGEDGYSLIRRVRSLSQQQGGSIPAIALTAFNQERDRHRALSAGFSGHMAKPVDLPLLCAEIKRLGQAGGTGREPLAHLRAATRALHDQLEEQPYARRVMDGHVSRAEYGAFLQSMSLLHGELERAIDGAEEPALHKVFADDMRKLPWLNQDLLELGMPSHPAECMATHAEALVARYQAAAAEDPFFLLGALYVLEGSSLGGRVQRRALLQRPEFATLGHRYLTGYDADTRAHFERFTQRLTAALHDDSKLDRAAAGAVSTFESMGKILDAILRDNSARVAEGMNACQSAPTNSLQSGR